MLADPSLVLSPKPGPCCHREQRHCLIRIFITKYNCPECWLKQGVPSSQPAPWGCCLSGHWVRAQPKAPGVTAGWVMALLRWIHTRVVHRQQGTSWWSHPALIQLHGRPGSGRTCSIVVQGLFPWLLLLSSMLILPKC